MCFGECEWVPRVAIWRIQEEKTGLSQNRCSQELRETKEAKAVTRDNGEKKEEQLTPPALTHKDPLVAQVLNHHWGLQTVPPLGLRVVTPRALDGWRQDAVLTSFLLHPEQVSHYFKSLSLNYKS